MSYELLGAMAAAVPRPSQPAKSQVRQLPAAPAAPPAAAPAVPVTPGVTLPGAGAAGKAALERAQAAGRRAQASGKAATAKRFTKLGPAIVAAGERALSADEQAAKNAAAIAEAAAEAGEVAVALQSRVDELFSAASAAQASASEETINKANELLERGQGIANSLNSNPGLFGPEFKEAYAELKAKAASFTAEVAAFQTTLSTPAPAQPPQVAPTVPSSPMPGSYEGGDDSGGGGGAVDDPSAMEDLLQAESEYAEGEDGGDPFADDQFADDLEQDGSDYFASELDEGSELPGSFKEGEAEAFTEATNRESVRGDVLGSALAKLDGRAVTVGGFDITAWSRKMNTLSQVSVGVARVLLKQGQQAINQANTVAKGKWYKPGSELPGQTKRDEVYWKLDWHAKELAKLNDRAANYAPGGDLKKWVMQAFIEANATEEGAAWINKFWSDMWDEIDAELLAIPGKIVDVTSKIPNELSKALTGLPLWAWAAIAVGAAGFLGYAVYRIAMAAAPTVVPMAANRYLPSSRLA